MKEIAITLTKREIEEAMAALDIYISKQVNDDLVTEDEMLDNIANAQSVIKKLALAYEAAQ